MYEKRFDWYFADKEWKEGGRILRNVIQIGAESPFKKKSDASNVAAVGFSPEIGYRLISNVGGIVIMLLLLTSSMVWIVIWK